MISVKNESERIPTAIEFTKKQIYELKRQISECDYDEDIDGNRVYAPGGYTEERAEFEDQLRQWEVMLQLLTDRTPFSCLGW